MGLINRLFFVKNNNKERKFVDYKKLIESGYKPCESIIELMQEPKYFHQEMIDFYTEANFNWIRYGEIYTLYSSRKDLIYKIDEENIAFKSGKGLNFETVLEIFTGSSWGFFFDDKNFLNDDRINNLGLNLKVYAPLVYSKINEKYDIFDSEKKDQTKVKMSNISILRI